MASRFVESGVYGVTPVDDADTFWHPQFFSTDTQWAFRQPTAVFEFDGHETWIRDSLSQTEYPAQRQGDGGRGCGTRGDRTEHGRLTR